ncbi:ABC transporter permease [Desulfurococcaceae archaeon MEX13E-LK6-19]|nr:ABC transporter permease [Desulfurococcaceae archaeon MEX13E-LK6-19]
MSGRRTLGEHAHAIKKLLARAWRKRIGFRIGLVLATIITFMAVFGPWIAPYPEEGWGIAKPETQLRGPQPPSIEHPFGTDILGRDLLSRILIGAGYALLQITLVVSISLVIGFVVGVTAAYYRGVIEKILNYFTEVFMAFPAIIIALALNTLVGRGLYVVIASLVITWWSWYARIAYVHARGIREMDYVVLAELAGVPSWKIVLRHIMPNTFTPVFVQAITDSGSVLLEAAAINFLGLGLPSDYPDWGVLVQNGFRYIYSYPWISLIPGAFILLAALGFSLLGDSLREELDPKLRRRWRLWF